MSAGTVEDPRADPRPDGRLAALLGDDALLDAPGVPPESRNHDVPVLVDGRRGRGRRRWRLELEVLTPLVIVDRVVGNNIRSRQEIPGTTLLPAVLSRLPAPGSVGLDDLRIGTAIPAFVDSEGTAHPAPLPPATWQRSDKGQGDTVRNIAVPDSEAPITSASRFKPSRKPAARTATGGHGGHRWREVRLGTTVSTHAVVNDRHRRPTKDAGGGLFSYHGIEPGTVLASDLVLPDGLEPFLTAGEELRLGRSRKDDFGRVRVRRFTRLPDITPRQVGADGVLRVWLLSDALLRDERLAPDPSPERLAKALGAALGIGEEALGVVSHEASDPSLRPTLAETARRDGFAPRWGRHRGSLIGLRAGTVVTFRLPDGTAIDPPRVAAVERDGIGDRTVEGYGRVLLDPPELLESTPEVERASRREPRPARPAHGDAQETPDTPLTGVDPGKPHSVEIAAWRRAIHRTVARIAVDGESGGHLPDLSRVTRAQRGVLRDQTARLARPGGEQLVRDWLGSLRISVVRQKAWDEKTLDRIEALLLDGAIWEVLNLEEAALVLGPGREALLRKELAGEAVTVLVDELVRQTQADETPGTGRADTTDTEREVRP